MAACPDNSTECLLRAILEANSGYNWNPITFAFTAAIGALALIIAVLTVFQGALAAGPGRLKASRTAIGPYAAFTKSHFSWTELRVRTVAKVPFMELRPLLAPSQSRWPWEKQELYSDNVPQIEYESIQQSYSQTSWLELIKYSRVKRPNWTVRESVTDYLPLDVVATPAAARIDCLVLLASLAGCETLEMVGGYPLMKGRTAQLKFREHPVLGTIAAFDRFTHEGGSGRDNLYLRCLTREACGELSYLKGNEFIDGAKEYYDIAYQKHHLALWDANNIYEDLLAPNDTHCTHDVCHKRVDIELEPNKWILLLIAGQTPIAKMFPSPFVKTFRGEVSKLKRLVDPWNSGQAKDVIDAIHKCIDPQRLTLRTIDLVFPPPSYDVAPSPSWLEAKKEFMVKPSNFGFNGHPYSTTELPICAPDKRTLDRCFQWLDEKHPSPSFNESYVRLRIIHLDWWIHHTAWDRARCCLLQMALDLGGPRNRIDWSNLDSSLTITPASVVAEPSAASQQPQAAPAQQQLPTARSVVNDPMSSDDPRNWHPLRALLFYRAVLVCMLISTAIDSDAFITSGVATEVVQVL